MLLDERTIRLDACGSADRSPLAGVVEERDVDVRISVEIVRLARLAVGVEEKVDAASLLISC